MRRRAALLVALVLPLLGGCVAAALPAVAAGVMAREQLVGRAAKARRAEEGASAAADVPAPTQAATATPVTVIPHADDDTLPPAGPGDYAPFARFAADLHRRREAGEPIASAVLVPNFTIERPAWVDCGARPAAVIVDLDPAASGPDAQLFIAAPERLINPSLGLAARLAELREAGIAILWLTDLPQEMESLIADTLKATGLDPAGTDRIRTAPMRGGRKQERRADLASLWCILAIAGDQRSDAEEAYDYLRNPDSALMLDPKWDAGWFLAPPPLVAHAMAPADTAEIAEPETITEESGE